MLTRTRSPRKNGASAMVIAAALLGLTITLVGGAPVARAESGAGDPFEYRLPGEMPAGGNARNGKLGNPGSTDADPDEFSVNNVGIRNPNVQIGPVSGPETPGRVSSPFRVSLLAWIRIWLPLFFNR